MIHSQDRAYWMGGSDADKIVGNWSTKTWENWWIQKLGLVPNSNFQNRYTRAGTYYEHYILRELRKNIVYDFQVKFPEYSLRVNFDGIDFEEPHIYEVKTYNAEKKFMVSKSYWRQAQTEIFALSKHLGKEVKLDIVAYPLEEENYNNYFTEIQREKMQLFPIERDDEFIDGELVPKMKILHDCLKKGIFPER